MDVFRARLATIGLPIAAFALATVPSLAAPVTFVALLLALLIAGGLSNEIRLRIGQPAMMRQVASAANRPRNRPT